MDMEEGFLKGPLLVRMSFLSPLLDWTQTLD
jgi:hypothetical protein